MRIMTEAIGSLVCGAGFRNIHDAGHIAVGTDANAECFARYLCDEFYQVPYASDPNSPRFLQNLSVEKKIDLVIPSLDEGMLGWAIAKKELANKGVAVAISEPRTIDICEDKWKTYLLFEENDIPTPKSSLENIYPLVKPRLGRGGESIYINNPDVDMENMISQELLHGTEYTVDVFCNINNEPIYIVPRVRLGVREGKSTAGLVVKNDNIDMYVRKICKAIPFLGAINIQCFVDDAGKVKFTEINPRWGGGTALAMAATENWIPLIVDTFVNHKTVTATKEVEYGLKMGRYYNEVFYK